MGLFSRKPKPYRLPGSPWPLAQGTTIEIIDIDPEFIEWARNAPTQPRKGHVVAVALHLNGSDINVVTNDCVKVARLKPELAAYYVGEFGQLQRSNRYGVTEAWIRPATWKSPHVVALNYSEHAAVGGGIL